MRFITDRAYAQVEKGLAKGCYSFVDLNRVESNVAQLCALAAELGVEIKLVTKTDWVQPADYDAAQWPTAAQMRRYLQNVTDLCNVFGIQANLPPSMSNLTVDGANSIEMALEKVYNEIQRRMSE